MANSRSLQALEKKAHELESEMGLEFRRLKKSSEKTAKIIIYAGVGAFAALAINRLFAGGHKEEKKEVIVEKEARNAKEVDSKHNEHSPTFSSRIRTATMTIVMDMARRKLMDFLNSRINDHNPSK